MISYRTMICLLNVLVWIWVEDKGKPATRHLLNTTSLTNGEGGGIPGRPEPGKQGEISAGAGTGSGLGTGAEHEAAPDGDHEHGATATNKLYLAARAKTTTSHWKVIKLWIPLHNQGIAIDGAITDSR